MSNTSNNDHNKDLTTQKLFEQPVIRRFNNPCINPNPSLGSLILQLHGFGVVNIMGIYIKETLVGDLVIKINHRRFDTHAQVWIKICNEAREWNKVAQF
jgi:hypothetical protein